ncbi:MAG: magnesium/cobalt transporter CorA [Anaerolineae bacterium]|nr:magnesium/cobalt transporter CorA [Thermoflexales bacterium]MDW8406572.1 magnesium/cobalt transporter CorA [Anaerolineae bacterium]
MQTTPSDGCVVRILYRDGDGIVRTTNAIDELPALLAAAKQSNGMRMVWVDLFPSDADAKQLAHHTERGQAYPSQAERVLRQVFAFHPLAVDDALIESHVPKIDDWGAHLYIVLHAVAWEPTLEEVDTQEVDIFLSRESLVTYHVKPTPAIDRAWQNALRDERHSRRGPDFLLYEICDAIAADYMPCMDAIEDAMDEVQEELFERPSGPMLNRALRIRRAVSHLRRVLSPQREVLNKLARDDYPVIDPKERVYFRDVYDHYVRMADLNESLRDLTSGSLETYLSVTANRTNQVMKALTIVTTLFMPLSFITGFFGMNFFGGATEVVHQIEPLVLFVLTVAAMIAIPAGMIFYIRRRGWW